jgi:Na+/H+-dicarboxylate symporter
MEESVSDAPQKPTGIPLYLKVVIGILCGAAVGWHFKQEPFWKGGSLTTDDLGQLGMLVIRLLKALATPLVFFGIVESLAKTTISGRHGLKLLFICIFNVTIAFAIGITLMNTIRPGEKWKGKTPALESTEKSEIRGSLSPLENLKGYIPVSLLNPFVENNIISIILLGLLTGSALRHLRSTREAQPYETAEHFVSAMFALFMQMLEWIVQIVPFAVFCTTAQVVGHFGIEVFQSLAWFLLVILLGLGTHSLIYYPFAVWLVGKRSPKVYLGKGADAVLTGLSTNSSLATVPVTLRCLKNMGVSDRSARLSACIGTNLNNDGIMLYEAMAALFVMQMLHLDLPFYQQVGVVFASVMAGVGIAGIPEAGLMVLPLVLSTVGLSEIEVAAMVALVSPVDWIIARARSGVNVLADMAVAILLDAGEAAET